MEKQYQIQYPSVMENKKLMYVHGFASSAQSGTVSVFRLLVGKSEVVA